jgi:dTDP-3-amino-2,3,6-trideoxy-4-keto-D-glucose/dTDP-3-amino-3,4,6-trideoxy-alpha-D-glucose/dTDP-2,6-dideoxy-D-kanosamine transaminase
MVYGHNTKLDTIQAVVGIHFMKRMNNIVRRRISNAQFLDKKLRKLQELEIPERSKSRKETFQMYSILCKERNKLKKHLNDQGIDAKIHYPIPMHLQKPSKKWGYKKGDFPMSEYVANNTLSLPVHEYVTEVDLKYMAKQIYEYYAY